MSKIDLPGKRAAAFDTCLSEDFEKAVKKMEKQIAQKLPGLELISPGLSIRVKGMSGPLADGEAAKANEFGARLASQSG